MADDFSERKRLTFAQAEGAEPLPSQLRLKELSDELRSLLWAEVHFSMQQCKAQPEYRQAVFGDPWRTVLMYKHVTRDHRMADEFTPDYKERTAEVKRIFTHGDYIQVFDFVQWLLRCPHCPPPLSNAISGALKRGRAAYSIFDRNTVVPIGSGEEGETIARAFSDLTAVEFQGARSHLRNAASDLTAGRYADSIRESIHAVESVAKVLDPSAITLDPALARLASAAVIHPALRQGFGKLYGYTNDERGVRHPLVDEPLAAVDETDALYMLGSCAAFVSYMINKARVAGLLQAKK